MSTTTTTTANLKLLYPLLVPVLPSIGKACFVMAVSVCIMALIPLAIQDIRDVISEPVAVSAAANSKVATASLQDAAAGDFVQVTSSVLSTVFSELLAIWHSQADMNIAKSGLKLLCLLMLHSGTSFLGHYLAEVASTKTGNTLRRVALATSLDLEWSERLLNNNAGSVLAACWFDSIGSVHHCVNDTITNIFPTLVNCIVTFIALWSLAPRIAVSLVALLVGFAALSESRQRRRRNFETEQQQFPVQQEPDEDIGTRVVNQQAKVQGFFGNVLERFPTVFIYSGQQLVRTRFDEMLATLQTLRDESAWFVHGTCGMHSRMITVASILGGILVVLLHRRGWIDVFVDLAVTGFYARQLVPSYDAAHGQLRKAWIELAKIAPLCDLLRNAEEDVLARQSRLQKEIAMTKKNSDRNDDKRNIIVECNHVSVGYRSFGSMSRSGSSRMTSSASSSSAPASPVTAAAAVVVPLINDATIAPIRAGEVIALRAESGQGKTLLLRMLAGLLQPISGELRFTNCSNDNSKTKKKVAYLEQAPVLLAGCTIAENIAMSEVCDEATRQKVRDAAERARCGSFIDDVMDLTIDGSGSLGSVPLSGGQLSRVCVARMLFADASLLLCDEPLNNLDAENSKAILQVISRRCAERGSPCAAIIASHQALPIERLRVVRVADGRVYDAKE